MRSPITNSGCVKSQCAEASTAASGPRWRQRTSVRGTPENYPFVYPSACQPHARRPLPTQPLIGRVVCPAKVILAGSDPGLPGNPSAICQSRQYSDSLPDPRPAASGPVIGARPQCALEEPCPRRCPTGAGNRRGKPPSGWLATNLSTDSAPPARPSGSQTNASDLRLPGTAVAFGYAFRVGRQGLEP